MTRAGRRNLEAKRPWIVFGALALSVGGATASAAYLASGRSDPSEPEPLAIAPAPQEQAVEPETPIAQASEPNRSESCAVCDQIDRLLEQKRFVSALGYAATAPGEVAPAMREKVRARWGESLAAISKTDLSRRINEIDAFLKFWPDDPSVRAVASRAESQHRAAVDRTEKMLLTVGFEANLRPAPKKSRTYDLVGSYAMGEDARLAIVADPKVGTIGVLAEMMAKVGSVIKASSINTGKVMVTLEGTRLKATFPTQCARRFLESKSDGARLDLMKCVRLGA